MLLGRTPSMGTTDFWLFLCQLAEATRGEGRTQNARLENIADSLELMPGVAQREAMREYHFLLAELNALEAKLAERAKKTE